MNKNVFIFLSGAEAVYEKKCDGSEIGKCLNSYGGESELGLAGPS